MNAPSSFLFNLFGLFCQTALRAEVPVETRGRQQRFLEEMETMP